MQIYLIRHAHAVDGENDAARPLSRKGREQIRRLGRFLRQTRVLEVREFWHSPLVRSRDTAKLLGQRLKVRPKLVEVTGLLYSDNPAIMAKRLGKVRHPVAVVGHEPHLGALLSLLVAGSAKPALFELRKCAVVALVRMNGRWVLQWQISPDLFERR